MSILTPESIQATREHFAANALACIAEAQAGAWFVNDLEKYVSEQRERHAEYLAGKWDHTLTSRQYATFVQTGKMNPILPK